MTGQLLSKDLVFFTFSSLQPRSKKAVTLLNWHIRLLEPTLLEHSLSWEAPMTEPLFTDLYHFYRVGAHSFLLFGETVADNVYRNVSDMILPFTNSTISQVVDRVVQGRMKKVAVAGLDPRMNVPIATKLLKGGLKLAQALQLSWQKSQIGRLAYKVGVHRAVSTAAWLSTRLHYMVVQDPPFPLKQYIKFYIMPTIRAAAASRQFNFTVPLPFVWEQYLSRPQPRLLSRQRQRRLEMNKGVLTDLPFMALLDRDHVHTFDGLHYDINVPKKTPCTYLLCTDLGVKNQSLLLNQGSATMVLRQSSVSLAWKGTVLINDSTVPQAVSKLPANLTHDQAKVSLSNGQLTVSVEGQMRMTYDQESQIYVIEMAGHLHNQSVGLLGTTTRDSGDDLRLPSGHIMANTSGFQQEYELSGQAVCKKESGQRVSSSSSDSSCEDLNAQVCRDLFTKGVSSPLESCFSVVDPQHFLDLCVRRTCQKLTHDPTKACPVVSTYVRLCANKGRQVKADTQTYRNACDSCSTGRQSRGSRHTVDLVMCPAMSSSDRSPEEMVNVIGNLAGHLNKGSRFGLVHGYKNHVHAHLFDGELFVTSKKLHKKLDASKLKAKENERGDNNHPPRVSDILEIAANYPFRASARRFVVLFTGPSTPRAQNVTQLQNQLSGQAISLIHVSTDLDFARVLSASWDGQVICRGCNRNEISIATTDMGKLAAETQGMYMSFDALKKGRSTRMRKLMRPFENIVSQPSPQCVGVTRGA
ncbi:uncharacterized protein LOC143295384 [Babylonia areolata]|uniref:uncharacterized protein LOC143295384 n=1 Tax=Babylonia areolata TaxID=304850 RepID=UPI003FD2C374